MKKIFIGVLAALLLTGCASGRTPLYLSEQFNDQVHKNLIVITLIDARPNKPAFIPSVNAVIKKDYMIHDVRDRGYHGELIEIDTSACPSLNNSSSLSDLTCINPNVFSNGENFLLISVDQYDAPLGMNVTPYIKITGALYTGATGSLLWKDQLSGDFSSANHDTAMYGLAGYLGDLMVKAISPGIILRNNVYFATDALLLSLPKSK